MNERELINRVFITLAKRLSDDKLMALLDDCLLERLDPDPVPGADADDEAMLADTIKVLRDELAARRTGR